MRFPKYCLSIARWSFCNSEKITLLSSKIAAISRANQVKKTLDLVAYLGNENIDRVTCCTECVFDRVARIVAKNLDLVGYLVKKTLDGVSYLAMKNLDHIAYLAKKTLDGVSYLAK